MKVKRKTKALPSRILKRKPKNPQMLRKLAVAIFITLLAALIYSAAASHTQDAKNQVKLQQQYHQLIQSKKAIQKTQASDAAKQKQIDDLNKKLEDTNKQLQAKKDSARVYAASLDDYVAPDPTPAPEPVVAAPVSSYHGTGDPYLDYIVDHESSGNQYVYNSIGACGLFQALPCSKLPCQLSDAPCQIAWGRNYAVERYGSTYAAYIYWVNNHYW